MALGIITAEACGPDFPLMLTECRSKCLNQVKSPGFTFDVERLTRDLPNPHPQDKKRFAVATQTIAELEASELPMVREQIARMRKASMGEEAFVVGDGLAEALRLYTSGAVDFNRVHHAIGWGEDGAVSTASEDPHTAEEVDSGFTNAIGWFQRVLALPSTEAEPRLVAASYMLARSYFLRGRPGDDANAIEQYRKTIELVESEHQDPLGLGYAALGDLGRIWLRQERFSEAANVYTRQLVAAGRPDVTISLWRTVSALSEHNDIVEREIGSPIVQRLLIAFTLSRADRTCDALGASYCGDDYPAPNAENGNPRKVPLLDAISHLKAEEVQWPDRVAAIAYSAGNYEMTADLLKHSSTPYADWIRAKLALHSGDMDGAAKFFAKASKSFATNQSDSVPQYVVERLNGELGVLSLSRRSYVEAMYQLSAARYFSDASYVAERVLTIGELKAVVDKEDWADRYRDLLARRLARVDRFDDAIPYYADQNVKSKATQYAEYRHQGKSAEPAIKKAEGFYNAAMLEFELGLELMGTEGCPDLAPYQGAFGAPCGQYPVDTPYTTDDEKNRFDVSAAAPDKRFHYRSVSVKHLLLAADNLPRRSHVISAVLCNGVAWLQKHNRDDNEYLTKAVYQRYVRDGRSEPWAQNFGSNCPEPDFKSAEAN